MLSLERLILLCRRFYSAGLFSSKALRLLLQMHEHICQMSRNLRRRLWTTIHITCGLRICETKLQTSSRLKDRGSHICGYEALIVWDIRPCSPLKVNRRFGGTCRLRLQCRRISREGNQHDSDDDCNVFFRNVCCLLTYCTALYSIRQNSSW
jgi:hypothetical protein